MGFIHTCGTLSSRGELSALIDAKCSRVVLGLAKNNLRKKLVVKPNSFLDMPI